MVQRPSNLDSACALALVQEEALESTRRRRVEPISNRMAWPHATAAVDHGRADGVYTEFDKNTRDNRRVESSADRVASLKAIVVRAVFVIAAWRNGFCDTSVRALFSYKQ